MMRMSPEIEIKIRALYAAVDKIIAETGVVCRASGKCCRFVEYDHTLFLTSLEAEILLKNRSMSTETIDPAICPFQVNGLCHAREDRPLGCRIFHCDPSYQNRSHEIMEDALSQIKQLCHEENLPWKYAPLHYYLHAFKDAIDQPQESISDPSIENELKLDQKALSEPDNNLSSALQKSLQISLPLL